MQPDLYRHVIVYVLVACTLRHINAYRRMLNAEQAADFGRVFIVYFRNKRLRLILDQFTVLKIFDALLICFICLTFVFFGVRNKTSFFHVLSVRNRMVACSCEYIRHLHCLLSVLTETNNKYAVFISRDVVGIKFWILFDKLFSFPDV